jgi:Fic family protein
MIRSLQGSFISKSVYGETVNTFIPAPLPPVPELKCSIDLQIKFDQALYSLGRLNSVSELLPDISIFLYSYIRKEAVLSSMIEGTQSSISDLLQYEIEQAPGVPIEDVREVSNYVSALDYGIAKLKEGFPLSLRLIREIHGILLSEGRGCSQSPGNFRTSQNWIGGTRPGNAVFVPPPPEYVVDCMGKLELFLHDIPAKTSPLLKAALAHVQFETIHPFLDGNGRLGRLIITLILCEQKILKDPLLYLSLYFKTHRQYYYELLNSVRTTGDWEKWLDFFADAVLSVTEQAFETAQKLSNLSKEHKLRIESLGRASESTFKVYMVFMANPIATSGFIVEKTKITSATVNKALEHLITLGIIKETTSQKRNRMFSYPGFIEIINQGTSLPE